MHAETRGHRFYLVRLAHGDGARRAESLKAFTERVYRETGVRIHPSELSEIETDKPSKAVTLDHVEAVATVDKMKRGKLWLGWGEEHDATKGQPIATFHIPDTMAETFSRARRDAAPPAPAEEPPKKTAAGGRRAPRHPKGRQ